MHNAFKSIFALTKGLLSNMLFKFLVEMFSQKIFPKTLQLHENVVYI